MDAGRRKVTPRLETKGFVTYDTQEATGSSQFCSFPSALILMGEYRWPRGGGGELHPQQVCITDAEPQVQEKSMFSIVPQANFTTLTLEGDSIFILLNSKQTCSLLHRVILSPRLSKRQFRTKLLVLLLATHTEM